jgi:PKHD-type hydroxylase
MIHISEFKKLNNEVLSGINECFDLSEFQKGKMSNIDPGHDRKNNKEMVLGDKNKNGYYDKCYKILLNAINSDQHFLEYTALKRFSGFIFSEYSEGMFYQKHSDHFSMGQVRTDWSCTVFLNDPSEYEGGELFIDIGCKEVGFKLNPGQYIIYPTGFEHRVSEVTSGKRRVCVFWIESAINDRRIRELNSDLFEIIEKYAEEWIANDQWLSQKMTKLRLNILRNFGSFTGRGI